MLKTQHTLEDGTVLKVGQTYQHQTLSMKAHHFTVLAIGKIRMFVVDQHGFETDHAIEDDWKYYIEPKK